MHIVSDRDPHDCSFSDKKGYHKNKYFIERSKFSVVCMSLFTSVWVNLLCVLKFWGRMGEVKSS